MNKMDNLIKQAKQKIPAPDTILRATWDRMALTKQEVQSEFGKVLVKFDQKATDIFRKYEGEAMRELAKLWLEHQKDEVRGRLESVLAQEEWTDFVEQASRLFTEFGILVQKLEKDLGNMRKARGGKTLEKAIAMLLDTLEIASEIPTGQVSKKLKRIDIVVPSTQVALDTPDRAVFITCKRTLRERWKQEVPQARPNQRIYLVTIDEALSENKAREINEQGLIAFVPDDVAESETLRAFSWIRRLSDLPRELRGALGLS